MDCGRRLGGEVGVGTGIVAEIRVEAWSVHAQFRGPALAPGLLSTRQCRPQHNQPEPRRFGFAHCQRPDARTRPLAPARGLQPGTPLHCRSSPATHQGADPPSRRLAPPAEPLLRPRPSSQLPWFRRSPTGILKPRPRPFRVQSPEVPWPLAFNLPASLAILRPILPWSLA